MKRSARTEKWINRILHVIRIYRENKMGVYAGNATLFIVTAAAPFVMLIIAVVNLLPGYSPKDVTDVLFQLLPDLSSIRVLVEGLVTNLKDQSGGLMASVAALTTLWSASVGVAAIQKGLNHLDQEKEAPGVKGTLNRLLFTLLLVILIPALLVFEMLGDSVVGIIHDILKKINPKGLDAIQTGIESFFQISALLVVVFAFLVILLIFAKLPVRKRPLKMELPGALLTGVGWFVFTELFSFFIPRFYHASSLYGSLASIFLLFLWCRFVIIILYVGFALNRTMEDERRLALER